MSKIISVGNISLGGTGKTPMTIKIANRYLDMGKKVCILSRGYKGGLGYDVNVISDGQTIFHEPPMAADEPYMMAVNCKGAVVITGKERKDAYNLAEERYSPDIYILDDAFQHKRMPRDADVLLLDHRRPVSTGLPFPFGYLREIPMGIERADVVVFTRATYNKVPHRAKMFVKDKPVFFSKIKFLGLEYKGKLMQYEDYHAERAFVFAGIAGSTGFFHFMDAQGVNIAGKKGFGDHYNYTEGDIQRLMQKAERKGATMMVTTEKDIVKIPDEYKDRFAVAKIEPELNDEEGFWNTLDEILSKAE